MTIKKAERDSNIELLRIFASMAVIALHYNIAYAFNAAAPGSLNYGILIGIESLSICAVNLFFLISGYFLYGKHSIRVGKAIDLFIQMEVFKIAFGLGIPILKHESLSPESVMRTLMPTNYFVILYIVVFLLSPYINKLLSSISDKAFKQLMIISVVLFSVLPTITDTLEFLFGWSLGDMSTIGREGSGYGYTIVNFVLMYLLGSCIKRLFDQKIKPRLLVILLALNLLVVFILGFFGMSTEYGLNFVYSYCNPFVISLAFLFFLLFKNINIGQRKIINKIAAASFTVYLTHGAFLSKLQITRFVKENVFVLLIHFVVSVVLLYAIGFVVYLVYNLFERLLHKIIPQKVYEKKIEVE